MAYTNQAIICVFTGSAAYDRTIKKSGENLVKKWADSHPANDCPGAFLKMQSVVECRGGGYRPDWEDPDVAGLKEFLPTVDDTWRLYICGHGDWKQATCGGVTGQAMAQLLIEGGLRSVRLISVVSCEGGSLNSGRCFAGDLHRCLGEGFTLDYPHFPGHDRRLRRIGRQGTYWYPKSAQVKVRTKVYARVCAVGVWVIAGKVIKRTAHETFLKDYREYLAKKKLAKDKTLPDKRPKLKLAHKRPASKIAYTWEGDKQVRQVVDYDSEDSSESKMDAAVQAIMDKMLAEEGEEAVHKFMEEVGREGGWKWDRANWKYV